MKKSCPSGFTLDQTPEGLIRNPDENIKMYDIRLFCQQFGINYESQSQNIWLIEFLFAGLADVHGLENDFLEVSKVGFILLNAQENNGDVLSNCTIGELIISHPLKPLAFEQNIILAQVLDSLYTVDKKEKLTDSFSKQSSVVPDDARQRIIALMAFLQLVRYIEKLAPQTIKILNSEPLRLFLQINKPLKLDLPFRADIPLWEKAFGTVTIEWANAASEPENAAEEMPENTGYSATTPFASYFRHYVNKQMMQLHEIAGRNLGPDEDFIHDTRVVFRSFLSLLDSFNPYLNNNWTLSVLRKIKPVYKQMGTIRDLDVLLLHLKNYMANQAFTQDLELLAGQLEDRRETALAKVSKYLLSQSYRSLLEELSGDIRATACRPVIDNKYNVIPFRLGELMPSIVGETSLSLFAYDEWLHGCYVSEKLLHRLRVSFKRLRYLLEFFREPFGNHVKDSIKICKQCQEWLGVMRDNCVARDFAAQFIKSLPPEENQPVIGSGILAYITYCDREASTCAGQFFDYWSEFGKIELKDHIRML